MKKPTNPLPSDIRYGGFLVLPIALVILVRLWPQAESAQPRVWLPGLALVLLALGLRTWFHERGQNWSETVTLLLVVVGLGYAKVSPRVTRADLDAATVAQDLDPATYGPARHDETYIEATYQYQLRPWWQIQPDLQYTFDPGGGVANPINPQSRVKNEAVAGVRTNVLF